MQKGAPAPERRQPDLEEAVREGERRVQVRQETDEEDKTWFIEENNLNQLNI